MARNLWHPVLFGLCVCTAAAAQAPVAPAQTPIVVKAGMLIDVESGIARSNQLLLIEGERIKAIGAAVTIPAGAKVIDLSRATVLPGLIDGHSHLLSNHKGELGGDDVNLNLVVTQMSSADRALLGAAMGKEALEAGITTLRDLGNSGWNGDVALRNAINNGWIVGPRIAASTRAIAPLGGQFSRVAHETRSIIEQEFAQITGVDEARRAVRQAVFDGADVIKVIAGHGAVSLAADEFKAIVDASHAARRKVAVHAMNDRLARLALEAGADSIEHGWFLSDDVLRTMAEKKVFLVPTDASWDLWVEDNGANSPYAAQTKVVFEGTQKRLRRAVELGVPVAAGSDVYYRRRSNRGGSSIMKIVRSFRDAGIPPIDIIRGATIRAAELIGWQDRVGSIQEGKFADLIAVPADPLQDVTVLERVAFVMKGGIVVKNDLAGGAAR